MKFTGERMIPEENKGQLVYLEHMTRYIFASQFVKGNKVLDIACGSGYGTKYLAERGAKEVIGVDNSVEAIEYAKKFFSAPTVKFIVGDAGKLPLANNSVDVVISFETIEHINDQKRFLGEIKRILKKGGIFIVSSPNPLVYPKGNTFHVNELTPKDFRSSISIYFKNVKFYYQNSIFSNYILAEESLEQNCYKTVHLKNLMNPPLSGEENLYIIGLASNSDLKEVSDLVTLYNNKDDELERLKLEIDKIQSSPSWKIATFLHSVRMKIPILRRFKR